MVAATRSLGVPAVGGDHSGFDMKDDKPILSEALAAKKIAAVGGRHRQSESALMTATRRGEAPGRDLFDPLSLRCLSAPSRLGLCPRISG
jgi:hypothetical protein